MLEILEDSLQFSGENSFEDFDCETLEILCTDTSEEDEQPIDKNDKGEEANDDPKDISWYDLFRIAYFRWGRDETILPDEEEITKKTKDVAGSDAQLFYFEDIFNASSKCEMLLLVMQITTTYLKKTLLREISIMRKIHLKILWMRNQGRWPTKR